MLKIKVNYQNRLGNILVSIKKIFRIKKKRITLIRIQAETKYFFI